MSALPAPAILAAPPSALAPATRTMRRWRPRQRLWLLWSVALLLAFAVFRLWPQLDLAVTAAVHDPAQGGFFLRQQALIQTVYLVVPWMGRAALLVTLLVCLLPDRWWAGPSRASRPSLQRWRRRSLALLIVLLAGLWGVVHLGLKDQVGRPRPHSVQDFGGPHAYQRVGTPSRLCERNCSFVSGHAATGYALAALGLVGAPAVRRRWAWAAAAAGTAIGAGRVLQGDHFASDIVFAALVMALSLLATRALWLRARARRLARARAAAMPRRTDVQG